MRSLTIILVFLTLSICSCVDAQNEQKNQPQEENKSLLKNELSDSEGKALDALDEIQISGWHLYSTFPNLEHDCQGDITSFKITKEQFEDALLKLLNQYYLDMPEEERIELATIASKAQEEYTIKTCTAASRVLIVEGSVNPPQSGMWIFQSLLNQRDLIIKW
ncbi:MAG: hypothetical protein ACI837_001475 [Crocinitomicaceae bacterium]|jgi:hypothetical protein